MFQHFRLSPWFLSVLLLLGAGRPAMAQAGPLTPAESVAKFTVADDLEWDLVLSEPQIAQPVFLNFDERGRMWVVEYRQYPEPAGLTLQSRDRFWRAVYDKVPPAPPNHTPGKDRISIHEDTDGDGTFDKHSTFIDGLNIVTAVVRGRGGVWVLNPPYLLFYPDQDDNDVPDGDPVVHLAGFGLEDTHSVANSLRWGSDGWLYGAQGSTVTGNVVRPGKDKTPVFSMGQLIWRYHPETTRYEIFSEGGGNAFGVEVDRAGRIFSGHNGGDTRGFHYMQGAYLQKGFNKHGPLSNPYAFGFFPPIPHHSVPRFTHNFLIYDGGALPPAYQGRLFGVAPLLSHVVLSEVTPDGSTFRTRDLSHPVTSADTWFRPVDIKTGPDGALYVADWYDGQTNHYRNHEGQIDKTNGRIYRLRAKGAKPEPRFDLRKSTSKELVARLDHPNIWHRQTALRLIADRKDATIRPLLLKQIREQQGQLALESLWALYLSGGLDDAIAAEMLRHPNPHVREWTVRLLGDERQVSPEIGRELIALAERETDIAVACQLACTAKRLPVEVCLSLVRGIAAGAPEVDDPRLPLLTWWAIEAQCADHPEEVVTLFGESDFRQRTLVQRHLLSRVMQRFALPGRRQDWLIAARLLDSAVEPSSRGKLMNGFEAAVKGRTLAGLPVELLRSLANAGGGSLPLQMRLGDSEAIKVALQRIADPRTPAAERIELVQAAGETRQPDAVPLLIEIIKTADEAGLRIAALNGLQGYDAPEIGTAVVKQLPTLSEEVRPPALALLASRKVWALQLAEAVAAEQIAAALIPVELVRKLTVHQDERLQELIAQHWGDVAGATTAEMQALISRLDGVLKEGLGDPYAGKKLYLTNCGKCHVLFGQGGFVGPDLTAYQRSGLETMLLNVVNPSAEIREGFETTVIATEDGRVVSGFISDSDPQVVVLRTADGQSLVVPQKEIEEQLVSPKSLMPEGLLRDYTDQQVRDLFAYLRSTQPLAD